MDAALFFCVGVLLSIPCCIVVPKLLTRSGYLDLPEERSSHIRPTPKGGGVGIALAFAVAGMVSGLPLWMWLPLLALATVSFVNDLRGISPGPRLAAQFAAGVVTLGWAWLTGMVAWPGLLFVPALVFVAAWANCYNFMDGINGMAGISGLVAFACLTAFQVFGDVSRDMLPLTATILGALLGFLPFNVPRARLFMGDAGSILLGFFFGLCVVLLARTWTEFLVLSSFLFPFYADESVTMAERLWRGESLLVPHRRHLYQFLANERGLAHWKISVGYGLIQFAVASAVVMASRYGVWAVLGVNLAGLGVWIAVHSDLKRRYVPNTKGV
jgi:Fuc2NAc and GlcNAc transferase